MAAYYRTGVETYSIIGTADERDSLEGRIPDGSTYFAVDENMFYTFYDGQWYETLPEAARLYHDDVGTDTKPIKLVGGVATVVANELAEDSKVVHLAGTETITDVKTFTKDPVIMKQDPGIELRSSSSSATTGWRGHIAVKDDSGATDLVQVAFAPSASGYTLMQIRVWKPDRSGNYVLDYRSYPDHPLLRGTSYLPTDSSGNPQVIESSGYMTSGMIAVDPRLVHVTGNETISGTKTFNAPIDGRFAEKTVSNDTTESHLWFKCFRVKAENGVNVRFGIRGSYNWPDSSNAFFSIGCAGNTEADIRCNCIYSTGISAELASLNNYKVKVEAFDGVNYLVFYVRRLNRYTSIRIYDYWATKWGADIPIIWYLNEWTSEPTSAIAISGYYFGGVLS